jgi:hypothetical protein
MKLVLTFLLYLPLCCSSQDSIFFRSSPPVAAKVLEVGPDFIKYKRVSNPEGPTYTIPVTEVNSIVYPNGLKESFQSKASHISLVDTLVFFSGTKLPVKISIVGDKTIKYRTLSNPDDSGPEVYKSEISYIIFASGAIQRFDINSRSSGQQIHSYYEKGRLDAMKYYRHPGGSIGTGIVTAIPCCGIGLGLIPAAIITSSDPSQKNLGMPRNSVAENTEYQRGYIEQARDTKIKKVWTAYGIGAAISLGLFLGLLLMTY